MKTIRRSGTSYAILGLLAIRPWSAYELTKQMGRTVAQVWPRAESHLYLEPTRLVEAGLATSRRTRAKGRERVIYEITPAGRDALDAWLREPAAPTLLESEAMIKVLFGNMVPTEVLQRHLRAFAEEAEAVEAPFRQIARDYLAGRGPFPERIHVNALYWVLLDRWARLRSEWAAWAMHVVDAWPDEHGPVDRDESFRLLRRALEDETPLVDLTPGGRDAGPPAERAS